MKAIGIFLIVIIALGMFFRAFSEGDDIAYLEEQLSKHTEWTNRGYTLYELTVPATKTSTPNLDPGLGITIEFNFDHPVYIADMDGNQITLVGPGQPDFRPDKKLAHKWQKLYIWSPTGQGWQDDIYMK